MANWIEGHTTQLIGALVLAAILGLYASIRESEIEDQVQNEEIEELKKDVEYLFDEVRRHDNYHLIEQTKNAAKWEDRNFDR